MTETVLDALLHFDSYIFGSSMGRNIYIFLIVNLCDKSENV